MAIGTTFKLSFDGQAVKRGLSSLNTSMKSMSDGILSVAKTGTMIGAAFIGSAAAVGAIGLQINKMGEDANATDKRLGSITKQMGIFGNESKSVTERLLDFADAQERATGAGGIVETQSKLMTFKELAQSADEAGGAFDRATMAAVDMASAGFGSAEQNAVQLGKALNDPVKGINALTRSGITFTDQEKKMIAEMVRMNQTAKAQDMILKAIETQVGGTAAATATASGRIKASATQIIEAFAIPFSEGFTRLPEQMELAFQSMVEKATKYGTILGDAIAQAVAGDMDKLTAIGDLIGSTIGAAAMAALMKVTSDSQMAVGNIFTQRKNWITGEVNPDDIKRQNEQKLSFQDLLDAKMINNGIQGKLDAVLGNRAGGAYQPSRQSPNYSNSEQGRMEYESMRKHYERVEQLLEQQTKGGAKL